MSSLYFFQAVIVIIVKPIANDEEVHIISIHKWAVLAGHTRHYAVLACCTLCASTPLRALRSCTLTRWVAAAEPNRRRESQTAWSSISLNFCLCFQEICNCHPDAHTSQLLTFFRLQPKICLHPATFINK